MHCGNCMYDHIYLIQYTCVHDAVSQVWAFGLHSCVVNICSANLSHIHDAVLQIRAFGLVLPAACTSLIAGTQKGALGDSHASV